MGEQNFQPVAQSASDLAGRYFLQAPAAQSSSAAAHLLLQAPQWFGSRILLTHERTRLSESVGEVTTVHSMRSGRDVHGFGADEEAY